MPTYSRHIQTRPPVNRQVRVFAFDPSVASELQTVDLAETTLEIPWESLSPGPVGGMVEVVDVDPSSNAAYQPVDLEHPHLRESHGLTPSEGSPMFHQQMVYASSMHTIKIFERALGRSVLWRPRERNRRVEILDANEEELGFVRRLRIYPHAFRQRNAYYDPDRRSLLFGYFRAPSQASARYAPNGVVFTCLSHDIIAHETTHALLDGMFPNLINATNDDMLAFHEGFSDIVAVFSHFMIPGVVEHELARCHGDLANPASLLAGLALQFGISSNQNGPLRSATKQFTPKDPSEIIEAHQRGNLLASAVYKAFCYIFERKTEDLRRLATGGSGILGPGAFSTDLTQRLADDAVTTASHVLTMCVRALDYVTPDDLTFGEFLRGIITADCDLVPNDRLHYRTAFIQAFRESGIYPPGVSGLGVDSVRWRKQLTADAKWTGNLARLLQKFSRNLAGNLNIPTTDDPRLCNFRRSLLLQRSLHGRIAVMIKNGQLDEDALSWLGLIPEGLFEIPYVQRVTRVGPDGQLLRQSIVHLNQRVLADLRKGTLTRQDCISYDEEKLSDPNLVVVRGGATLIFDLDTNELSYSIRKNIVNNDRWRMRREWELRRRVGRPNTIAADTAGQPFAMLHRVGRNFSTW